MRLTLQAERWPEPGKAALVLRRDGEVLRSFVVTYDEGERLGFDLCRLCCATKREERTET
jgi:hypothetical protein